MKRRNFLHWVLSLPLVGSIVGRLSGRSNMEEFARQSGQIWGEHLVAQRERSSLQRYADEVAEVFNSMFCESWITSRVAMSVQAGKLEPILYPHAKDHPVIDKIEHKYVAYLYGDKPTVGYSMDMPHKSRMVLAVKNLVNAVKQDMEELGSEKVVFFTPFSPLPPGYGVVQVTSQSYSTSIGVSFDHTPLSQGLCVSISVAYGVDVSS